MSVSGDVKDRITKLFDKESWYCEKLEMVPEELKGKGRKVIGLGYKWFPISVIADSTLDIGEFMENVKALIHPCINTWRGCDITKNVSYSDDEVIKDIVKDIFGRGNPIFYDGLNIYQTVLDPNDIIQEIKEIRNKENSHFVGFMSAFDLCSLQIDEKVLYLQQENCRGPPSTIKVGKYHLSICLEPENNRVFNWHLNIGVSKKSPYESDSDSESDESSTVRQRKSWIR